MVVRISSLLQAQMLAEAAATPEREVCGLLFGVADEEVTTIRPCANVAADPAKTFEINPASLIAAHKAQRSGGPVLIGCYHSHPNGAGEPSLRDRKAAGGKQRLWLIIADNRIRAWILEGDGTYEEVGIVPAY